MGMKIIAALVVAIALPLTSFAQERSAGQAYESQANYGALSAKLNMLTNQNQAIAGTVNNLTNRVSGTEAIVSNTTANVDHINTCANKAMLYSPTSAGADTDGCIKPKGGLSWGDTVPSSPNCSVQYQSNPFLSTITTITIPMQPDSAGFYNNQLEPKYTGANVQTKSSGFNSSTMTGTITTTTTYSCTRYYVNGGFTSCACTSSQLSSFIPSNPCAGTSCNNGSGGG